MTIKNKKEISCKLDTVIKMENSYTKDKEVEMTNNSKVEKKSLLKFLSSNYMWIPITTILISSILICYLIDSQNNSTKEYVKSIIKEIKQDTTKYKLDSITNHRLITLEINQSSYSNNISFYSIFITVLLALFVIIIGFAVYLNNKENVYQLKEKHKEFDQSQKELDDKFVAMKNLQDNLQVYVDAQTEDIKEIIEEQKYYQFEIFDNLHRTEYENFRMNKANYLFTYSLMNLSNAWTYYNIKINSIPNDRNSIYKKREITEDFLNEIEEEFKLQNNYFEMDIKFSKENKEIILFNLNDSLKFINDIDIQHRIEYIIEIFKSFKTNDINE